MDRRITFRFYKVTRHQKAQMTFGNALTQIGRVIETFAPATAGVVTFIALFLSRDLILHLIVDDKISVANLYNAVFGWSAIQTGCLYAIYGYVAGKTDGFIGEIRSSRSMKRYNSYLKRATVIGFLLTFSSMPLIVWNYKVSLDDHLWYWLVSAWFSLFVWAFVSFARVAYIFGILVKVGEPESVPAG
jgi:hypothetical protein